MGEKYSLSHLSNSSQNFLKQEGQFLFLCYPQPTSSESTNTCLFLFQNTSKIHPFCCCPGTTSQTLISSHLIFFLLLLKTILQCFSNCGMCRNHPDVYLNKDFFKKPTRFTHYTDLNMYRSTESLIQEV